MAMVKKYYEFKKEDIENGKYSAWKLIEPLWWTVDIYNDFETYESCFRDFTDAQKKIFCYVLV